MDKQKILHGVKCLGCALVRIVLIVVILAGGVFVMKKFASMRKPPARQQAQEPVFQVNAIEVASDDVQVVLEGFGNARARQRVGISPEVQGQIVELNPKVQVGETVDDGELLAKIDPRDYQIALAQAKAELQRLKAERNRLNTAWENDKRRLEIAKRSEELAQSDFQRVKNLFETDEVGTKAGVEQAEGRLNQQRDIVVSLENAISLYPVSLDENKARIAAAESAVDRAQLSLERTEIRAPFQGRIAFEDTEIGQVVAPGRNIITLVDDSHLEIPVSLDSQDAERWLPLRDNEQDATWIVLERKSVDVYWVQDALERSIEGALARVEDYDEASRTLIVVIDVNQEGTSSEFPLVEGMFCRVEIPGRTAEDVFSLPATAVSHEGTVVLSKSNRIKTQPVGIVYRSGAEVLVKEGLEEGDLVVTSRLAKVVEGASLELTIQPDVVIE